MFRSYDHPQEAYFVLCVSHTAYDSHIAQDMLPQHQINIMK